MSACSNTFHGENNAIGQRVASIYRNESHGPDSGDVTTWLYDEASGVMTNKVYADGKGPTYSYTPDCKLSRRVWARGVATDYAYDGWGNLTNTVYSDDTPTVSIAYDVHGRQIEARDAAGVTTFAYDAFGANTNETVVGVAGTNTTERFFDAFGRDVGYALNGVRQSTLAYDPATGRLSTMHAAGSDTPFTWNYADGSELKSSLAYPNGLTASWLYDANNQLLQVCNATPTNTISQYDYVYDVAGRRINVSKSGTAFDHDDTIAYGYNSRSELTNAVAAVDSDYRYSYEFDDIGNRKTSSERGTNSVYAANNLNQYTSVNDFIPQFDDDGNQTLIKTSTGIWSVTYNGENRPTLWSCIQSNNTNNQTILSMSYDRQGRRVTKNEQRFVYDGYLQIADDGGNVYIWDPIEKIATRPLVWNCGPSAAYYTHDGNKNVSDLVFLSGGFGDAMHYEYDPFGVLSASTRNSTSTAYDFRTDNHFRFSSEYADDALGLIYYNYRHYAPVSGRWCSRDSLGEDSSLHLALFCHNSSIARYDLLGLIVHPMFGFDTDWWFEKDRPARTPLEKDRDELESRLAASCPQGDEPIETRWKSSCCKESCKQQAKLLADLIYDSINQNATEYGGPLGNMIISFESLLGVPQDQPDALACGQWQAIVGDAYDKYKADGSFTEKERCFDEVDKDAFIHKWVSIASPDSSTSIWIDPWWTGGGRMW